MSSTNTQTTRDTRRGVVVPDEKTIIVSRIYNWLFKLNEDVKPASCFVVDVEPDFGVFFNKISEKLAESAGVNVIVDDVAEKIEAYKATINAGDVVCIDSSKEFNTETYRGYELFLVADSLRMKSEKSRQRFPRHISIFEAFNKAYLAHQNGSRIVLDFAEVRDKDEWSSGRQSFMDVCNQISDFAKGPAFVSFLKTMSAICGTIKKGGFRRHGAMTANCKVSSPSIGEFIDIPFGDLNYVKKGVSFDIKPDLRLLKKLIQKQNDGELFFAKLGGFSKGVELRNNVCMGLFLIPNDQCLVSPVNLGQCQTYADISQAIVQTTQFLLDVRSAQVKEGFNLLDEQIAVGFCGLANLLRIFKVSYPDFIDALNIFTHGWVDLAAEDLEQNTAMQLVLALNKGILESAILGKRAGMRAIFAIEPNASCSRRVKDCQGFDIVPNIDPPDVIPGVGIERRHSETGVFDYNGNKLSNTFFYGTDIFPAQELTELQHFLLWDGFQRLINRSGLAHTASYEQWFPLTAASFIQWYESSLMTIYYNRSVGTKHLGKVAKENNRALAAREKLTNQQSVKDTSAKETTKLGCSLTARAEGCESCD